MKIIEKIRKEKALRIGFIVPFGVPRHCQIEYSKILSVSSIQILHMPIIIKRFS